MKTIFRIIFSCVLAFTASAQTQLRINNQTRVLDAASTPVAFPQGGLLLRDTDSTNNLIISNGDNLSADRTLIFNTLGNTSVTFPTSGTLLTSTSVGNVSLTSLTGDVTTSGFGAAVATLATVNSNVGTFGNATQVAQITVNAKGLATSVANVTLTPAASSLTGIVSGANGGTGVANTGLTLNFGTGGTLAGGAFAPFATNTEAKIGTAAGTIISPNDLAAASVLPTYALRNTWNALYAIGSGLTPPGNAATIAQKQIRALSIGDSVANLIPQFLNGNLQMAYGKIGSGPQGLTAVTAGDVTVPDGSTLAYDYTIFPSGNFWSVGVGGSVLWNDGGNAVACDTLKVYYIIEPTTAAGGGTFKVQSSQDAGAFADEASYTNVSASGSLSLGIITISKTQGNWRSKVVGLTGRVRFIIPRYPSASLAGCEVYRFDRGGIFLDPTGMNAINQGILNSLLADIAPTTAFFQMKEDSSTFATGLATMHSKWGTAWSTMDWIEFATTPTISPPSTFSNADQIITNQQLRADAVNGGYAFVDLYTPAAAMITGLTDYTSSDGTHLVNGLWAALSGQVMAAMPILFNNPYSRPAYNLYTASGVIGFGQATDVLLYRAGAASLRTNSALTVDGAGTIGGKLGVGGGTAPTGTQFGVFRNQFGDVRLLIETTNATSGSDILFSATSGNFTFGMRNDSPATSAPNGDLTFFKGSTYSGINFGSNGIYARPFTDVFSGGTTFTANKGVVPNNASRLTYTLPADVAPVGCKPGDEFRITGNSAGGWKIAQQAGQTIRWGGYTTTTGTSGYVQSNDRYAAVTVRCTVAGTDFVIVNATGLIDFDTASSLVIGDALPVAQGGTGQTTYTNGQILIGNTTGNTLTKATLTAGAGTTITNGTGTITIAHSAAVAATEAYGAGTAYTLTATPAAVDFGTTDPSITIATAGTYTISGQVNLFYNAATFAGNQTATLTFRRTNNTPANLTNGTIATTTQVITALTYTYGVVRLPDISYTASAGDIVTIYADISATPGAGSFQAVASGTFIRAKQDF